jgi:hypothetical protein
LKRLVARGEEIGTGSRSEKPLLCPKKTPKRPKTETILKAE